MANGRIRVSGFATEKILMTPTLDAAESGGVYNDATAGESCLGSVLLSLVSSFDAPYATIYSLAMQWPDVHACYHVILL